ncbi:putative monosaccharide ABC transporter substrate-binding protein, cut2 family [Magnetofaba australis IT-1]|uniref:Putative monosaccharide ABC transporter substrate-binding protein, cut2 family n=2 Tax=Magnetofaba TaxID=1472292 RepID=A0A1Y2K1E6_9PROT|nr:putative monosaccharide ABC transporter substrate-binding protein, cut2 family [Magnetofaba australis IT-1]
MTLATAARAQEPAPAHASPTAAAPKLAYLVSDLRIPFWRIMARGIEHSAKALGYQVTVMSAENDARNELQHAVTALKSDIVGLIASPTNSAAGATILKMAAKAGVPVIIADIGADDGHYVSYISSDNRQGAYEIGLVLVERLRELNWMDGSVGIIAIPQKRENGQARTRGFMKALSENGVRGAGLRQQVDFSRDETYKHARALIAEHPEMRALWLQGSDRYQAALDAIDDSGKTGQILLLTFDAEPEFLQLIPQGALVGAAMQQPFLMGEKAVSTLHRHLLGQRVPREIQLPILAISANNIAEKLPIIRRNVLGLNEGG